MVLILPSFFLFYLLFISLFSVTPTLPISPHTHWVEQDKTKHFTNFILIQIKTFRGRQIIWVFLVQGSLKLCVLVSLSSLWGGSVCSILQGEGRRVFNGEKIADLAHFVCLNVFYLKIVARW